MRSIGALRIDLRGEAGCSTVEPGQQLPSLCCSLLGSWLPPGMSGPQPVSLRSQDSHRMSGPPWFCRTCHEASTVSAFSRNVRALSCSFGSQFLLGASHCLCTTIGVRRQPELKNPQLICRKLVWKHGGNSLLEAVDRFYAHG